MADLKEQLDVAERLLARNLAWIAAADAKVPAIFGIDAAMLGILSALVPGTKQWTIAAAITSTISTLLLLVSIACLAFATFPRLTGPKGSLIFFGTAVVYQADDFISRVRKGITEELVIDAAQQAYRNAEIASEKYKHVKYAQILLFTAALPWLLSIALLYLACH